MKNVVVVGSGPAGLAAAEAIQDQGGGEIAVELVTLGHHLGGKAASWRLEDGRVVEHGQHVALGFYRELAALVERAGVSWHDSTVPSGGEYTMFEERDGGTHHLYAAGDLVRLALDWAAYTGFTEAEKAGITAFVLRMVLDLGGPLPESLDDHCFTAWALSRGFPVSAAAAHLFQANREVQMNWPGEISAYAMLRTLRAVSRAPAHLMSRYPRGGMSELWWEPVARRIEALGGTVTRTWKLTAIEHADGALRGLELTFPQPHGPGVRHHGSVPVLEGAILNRRGIDAAVLTLPPSSLVEVLDPELRALPGLSGIPRLKTVAPLAMQIWHRNRTHGRPGVIVAGLEPPLNFLMDNARNYPDYLEGRPGFGAALHFTGQLTGFERMDDEALLQRTLASVRKVEGYEGMDREGVLDFVVLRHDAPHKRYWNSEPGSVRFKPQPRTPLRGLYLAGDWVRSELDFPCMESAVRSGREAAALVLEDLLGGKAARRRRVA